jgi:hypothetical protein
VNANKHRFTGVDSTHDKGYVLLTRYTVSVAVNAEFARFGGQGGTGNLLDQVFVPHAIGDEVGDSENAETVLASELLQPRQTGHLAVVVHDLAQDTRRSETSHSRKVDRSFGVARALQDSPSACAKGKHVAGFLKIARLGFRIDHRPHCRCTVVGGDAGGDSLFCLDADREGCAVGRGVLLHHQREFELVAALTSDRHANQTTAEAGHEIDRIRSHFVGGEDQIALVLTFGVVDDDDLLTASNPRHRFLNRDENVIAVGHAHSHPPRRAASPNSSRSPFTSQG